MECLGEYFLSQFHRYILKVSRMSNFTPIYRYTKNRSKSVSHFVICQEGDIYIPFVANYKVRYRLGTFLVYLCIGVKLLILDTLSTYTYEIDLKNLHLNTPFLLVLNNSMRGGVNNFMPFRKQRLSKCCIFGDIFSKYMNLSIFVLRLI